MSKEKLTQDDTLTALAPLARQVINNINERYAERELDAGKLNRHTASWYSSPYGGDLSDLAVVQRTRNRAWNEYRNNHYASKSVRAIVTRMLGSGIVPDSRALTAELEPWADFRQRSQELYHRFAIEASDLGKPGYGGLSLFEICCQALTETIISGEAFLRFRRLSVAEQRARKLSIPLTLQLIEAERVTEDYTTVANIDEGNTVFRGIELDANGKRVAYHIRTTHPNHPHHPTYHTVRIPADEVIHLYRQQRPSQLRGFSWLSPVLMQLKDISDFQFNELVAAAVSACVVIAITRESNNTSNLGLAAPTNKDNTDSDGNKIDRVQPGMVANLNPGEKIEGFSPNRPNTDAEQFITHLLRGVAAGLPGVKASQITGDYRQSSFSSERSAENDLFPEIEGLQNWFFNSFCGPVWEQMINAGLVSGWFDGLAVPAPDNYQAINRQMLVDATWRGPKSKSVNPIQDETAAAKAIANGTSDVISETANKGKDWRAVMQQNAEWIKAAEQAGYPEAFISTILGVLQQVAPAESLDGTAQK